MALPNFRLSIFKRYQPESWSNDWLLNVADMAEAVTVANALVEFERRMHANLVSFEYYLISTMQVGDRSFRHVAINQLGYVTQTAAESLPLFNVLRVDLTTNDSDPCRKYFRMPVSEGQIDSGKFVAGTLTSFASLITTHFNNSIAIDNVVSGRGNVVTGASANPFVQMRQLHRRNKKKVP